MSYLRIGKYNPKALDKEMEIQPFENSRKNSLHRLNYLLGFIKEKKPSILEDFISNLENRLSELVKKNFITENSIEAKKFYEDFKNLKENQKLADLTLNFYLQMLDARNITDWLIDNASVLTGNYFRSFLVPMYYNVLALTETIDRKEAVKLYKQYITHYLIDKQANIKENRYESAEAIFERRKQDKDSDSPWVIVCGMWKDGKYFYRNDNCLWIDALTEYPDSELKYLVCCYGDYEGAKIGYNSNFILTMEHTIAQGDKYCSRVVHDTLVDWDLRHPPTEFWDNIKPENE